MASLFIIIVGLLELLNVQSAPTPLTNRALSQRLAFYNVNTQKQTPTPLEIIDNFNVPTIDNRFNFDDKRQNWGLLINGSIYNENDNTNYAYRPITIPRLSPSNPPLAKVNIEVKQPEVKPKRFLEKATEVNTVLKETNDEPRKIPSQCDVARTKCCFDKSQLDSCSKANECFKPQDASALCDPKVLQQSLRRLLNMF